MNKKMSALELILNIFNAVSSNLTEDEYKLLQIPRYQIFKRKKFSNIYKTLLLYLTRLSISESFPNGKNMLLKIFDECYNLAYINDRSAKIKINEDLKKFKELTNFNRKRPFENLSLYIVELFEQRPRKLLFIVLLEKRIEDLYKNFINAGKKIEITKKPDQIDIINKIKEKLKQTVI